LYGRKSIEPFGIFDKRFHLRAYTHVPLTDLRKIGLFSGQEFLLMRLWNIDSQTQKTLTDSPGISHATAITFSVWKKRDLLQGGIPLQ
jgi:hypothetical protein